VVVTVSLSILQDLRVSNAKTFRKCKRKAFFQTVARDEVAHLARNTSSQTFGTVAHKIIELWLTKAFLPPINPSTARTFAAIAILDHDFCDKVGKDLSIELIIEAAKVATKGLGLLPAPGPGLVVEEPFSTDLNGVTFRSHGIDLYDTRPDAKIRLYDHKTCKTLGYVPTPEEMREDVQAISYAYELMLKHGCDPQTCGPRCSGWGDVIACRWIYYPRSNEPAKAVDFSFTWQELETKWLQIAADVNTLARLAEASTWDQVEGNAEHCGDYGGCEFLSKCQSVNDDGESLFTKQRREIGNMGLLDRARSGEKVGAAVSAPIPQPSSQSLFAQKAAASLPPPQTTQQLHDTLAVSLKAAGIEPAVDLSAAEVQEDLETGGDLDAAEPIATLAFATGINPPDAAPADPTPPEPKAKKPRGKKAAQSEVVSVSNGQEPVTMIEATLTKEDLDQLQRHTVNAVTLTRTEIVAKLRAKAEAERSLDLFITANLLERGEL
jgi:hypothetical protein